MERKVQRINMGQVIASPVLTGNNDQYMWTGIVRSDRIDKHIIPDDRQRESFVKLVREVEQNVLKYRASFRSANSVLKIKPEESLAVLENRILELCREVKAVINNPDSIGLDMDLYWVALCRDYEEIKQKNPNEFIPMNKDARKNLEIFREYVNRNDPPIREMYVPETNKYTCVQFLTHGQEAKIQKGKETNTERLLGVLESIAGKKDLSSEEGIEILKELSGSLTLVDLPVIFPNKKYSDMQYITVFKNYLIGKGFSYEDIEAMSIQDIVDEAMRTYNENSFEFHSSLVAETIINGIDYLDIEKVMLLAAARPLEAYELMSPKVQSTDPTESEMVKILTEKEEEGLERLESFHVEETHLYDAIEKTRRTEFIIRKILESGIIDRRTRIKFNTGDKEQEVSLRRIEELMQKFCDGVYLSETMQLALVFDAFTTENAVEEYWSDELVRRINLSDNDMYVLSIVNFENLKRFYSLGRMNKDHITNLLDDVYSGALDENIELTFGNTQEDKKASMKQNNRNLLKNLYASRIIEEKDIAEYFDLGIISIEQLETLEEDKTPEEISKMHDALKQEFNEDRLLLSYKNYIVKYNEFIRFQKEHPEETEKIEALREEINGLRTEKERYRQVFNKYNHIPENEKVAFGEDLLAKYYVELEVDEADMQESIKVLYEDGFIELENIINLDKKEQKYLIPMLDTLSIKDADKIRSNMTFEELINMLDTIFVDPSFNDERKWIIVMNLLGEETEQDKKAREEYLEMLDFDNETERKAKSKGTRKIKNHGTGGNDSAKNIYPDAVKWKFYKALDKDARVTRYSNGFVEFASSKLGVRIIEKYYDGNKPAYGTATYILPEDEYRKHEGDLVTIIPNGLILESTTLRDITPRKDRIAHITKSTDKTWMDQMVRYFGIDYEREDDPRYSKQELQELQATVSKYKTKFDPETEK